MTYSDTRYLAAAAATDRYDAATGTLHWIFKSIWRAMMIARQRRALQGLSDTMLKDIGLSRSDIDGVTAELIDGYTDTTRNSRSRNSPVSRAKEPSSWV